MTAEELKVLTVTTAMLNRMREEHRHVGTITLGKAQHLAYPRDPPFQTSAEIPGQHGAAHESVRWHPHTLLLAQAFSLIPESPYEWTGSHVLPQEHLSTLIPPIGRESQAVDKLLRDQGQGAIFLRASADPATLQRAGEAASYVLTAPPHEHIVRRFIQRSGALHIHHIAKFCAHGAKEGLVHTRAPRVEDFIQATPHPAALASVESRVTAPPRQRAGGRRANGHVVGQSPGLHGTEADRQNMPQPRL